MKAYTDDDITLVTRAMRSAARQGTDPRNSHPVQADKWDLKWKRREKYRAERDAKRLRLRQYFTI
jgi:hypothetical protein